MCAKKIKGWKIITIPKYILDALKKDTAFVRKQNRGRKKVGLPKLI